MDGNPQAGAHLVFERTPFSKGPCMDITNTRSKPWYQTLDGWKLRLEIFAIPFVMLYAVVSYLQWRDLRASSAHLINVPG